MTTMEGRKTKMEKVTDRLCKYRKQMTVNSLITDASWYGKPKSKADVVYKAVIYV